MIGSSLYLLGWLLLDASIRIVLVAAATALVLHLVPRRLAAARYWIACAALGIAALIGATAATHAISPRATGASVNPSAPSANARTKDSWWKCQWIATSHRTPAEHVTWAERVGRRLDPGIALAAFVWLSGMALSAAWRAGGWWRLRRLLRGGSELRDAPLRARLTELSRHLGLREPLPVVTTSRVDVPMVAGVAKPTLVVPECLMASDDRSSLEAVLAHELAHARRRDGLLNFVQTVIETLFFYHPGVWWLSAVARRERENCCDDDAVRVLRDELVYARSLLRLQERRRFWPQASLTATGGAFAARIERLCARAAPDPPARGARTFALAAVDMFALALVVAAAVWSEPAALAGVPAAGASLRAGLLAHYPLDGDADDRSGQGNHGVVQGARPAPDRLGNAGRAIEFDGIDDRIQVPSAPALGDGRSVTVSAWVAPRSHRQYLSWIARSNDDGATSQWRVGLGASADEWGVSEFAPLSGRNRWQDFWVTGDALPLGEWSHLVAVADQSAGQVTLYRNGLRVATVGDLQPFRPSIGPSYIGYQADDRVFFDGSIDDLRIYGRALTPAEVRALYQERP